MPKVLRMIDHILICLSLANDESEYGQANVLQMIYWSLDMLKCCIVVVVVLLFYVHGKHLRSCRDGQLT